MEILPQFEVFIASPEDVIIKKLDFYREGGSEKHLTDIREILAGCEVDNTYLEDWVQRMGLQAEYLNQCSELARVSMEAPIDFSIIPNKYK